MAARTVADGSRRNTAGHRRGLGYLVWWSFAITLYLVVAPAAAAETAAVSSEPTRATGESWIPNAAANAAPENSVATTVVTSSQVSTTPGAAVAATPPTVPTQASQGFARAPNQDAAADADPEALTMFRADLDPHGTWVDDPRYGRVWIPNRDIVGSNFSPYVTSGHWALDGDDNWVWVSDYPFGHVVFHYGRWFYSAEYGWAWVPGRTYAPSWVIWRTPTNSTYAYVGWAPMPPRYGWFSSGVVWYSTMPPVSYVFCPSDYLFYPSVGVYVVHDPWLVGRLGLYTSLYYPPYGYYGWGYYGYGYGGMGYHHTHYYGPPVYRTGISQRAIPRERISARPGVWGTSRGMPNTSPTFRDRSGRFSASPNVAGFQRTRESGPASRGSTSWTAPRTSPLARPTASSAFTSRASPATSWTAPRTSPLARPTVSSAVGGRSSFSGGSPRSVSRSPSTPSFGASSRSVPSFGTTPRSAPSFHSSPSFRSPSFHSSPSFRAGGRHR